MMSDRMRASAESELFSRNLGKWWDRNKRNFPWRNTFDPYHVMVAEVLLHRTRANQVIPVYQDLVSRFPTVKSLSLAALDDVKRIIHPLGLHWRTNLLYEAVGKVMNQHNGRIPSGKRELESLPGVGHYIASAIRCFAYGYPEVLLDTNIVRILGKFFGIEVTSSSRRSKYIHKLCRNLLDVEQPRAFNWAMLDLGALVCKPKHPLCGSCPVGVRCSYKKTYPATPSPPPQSSQRHARAHSAVYIINTRARKE